MYNMSINASNGKDSSLNWKVFITPGIPITTDTTKTARELYEQMLNLYPDGVHPQKERQKVRVLNMSELLDLALQAAGGLERWRQIRSLDVRVSVTGALYQIKGYPEGVPETTMRIDTRTPSVIISPYSRPDRRGYFTPDRVWIEDRAGKIIEERKNPRASFAGHVYETPWDQLHRLYFTSYVPVSR
jgi:hypothetical protein